MVLLTTTGARSGSPRTVPVLGLPTSAGLAVIVYEIVRDADGTGRLADRSGDGKISHQRGGVAALVRGKRRQKDEDILGAQQRGQPRAGGGVREIDVA